MKRSISKTAGNVYNKIDKANWMVRPKFGEVPRTSFLDVCNLVLAKNKSNIDVAEVNVSKVLNKMAAGKR